MPGIHRLKVSETFNLYIAILSEPNNKEFFEIIKNFTRVIEKKDIVYKLDELDKVVAAISSKLVSEQIILLKGELGAGKTTLIKAICHQLSVTESVSSPTYSLANIYEGKIKINHLDLYRLKSEEEALEMGIEEYLYDKKALTLIEWPEVIEAILPENILEIRIEALENGDRKAEIIPGYGS